MKRAVPLLAIALLAGCGSSAKPPVKTHPRGRVVHAPLCYPGRVSHLKSCRSPDGRWTVRQKSGQGRLVLTNVGTGRGAVVYSSHDSCCDDIAWARPHRLFFADDYQTFTLDPARRKVTFVAAFSSFYASPDGVWVAGYDFVAPHEPELAALVKVANRRCVLFPGRRNYVGGDFGSDPRTPATGFSRDGKYVVVAKSSARAVRYRIASLNDPCPTE